MSVVSAVFIHIFFPTNFKGKSFGQDEPSSSSQKSRMSNVIMLVVGIGIIPSCFQSSDEIVFQTCLWLKGLSCM